MRESEQCLKQQTGSCEGCPVLATLLHEVRMRSVGSPSSVRYELRGIAQEVATERCPLGMSPDTDLISIGVSSGGFAGKIATVTLRNYEG